MFQRSRKHHRFSMNEFLFLATNIHGRSFKELTKMFNAHFELDLSVTQIKNFTEKQKLYNGLNTKVKKDQVSKK